MPRPSKKLSCRKDYGPNDPPAWVPQEPTPIPVEYRIARLPSSPPLSPLPPPLPPSVGHVTPAPVPEPAEDLDNHYNYDIDREMEALFAALQVDSDAAAPIDLDKDKVADILVCTAVSLSNAVWVVSTDLQYHQLGRRD